MAKTSSVEKNKRRIKMSKQYDAKRRALKAVAKDRSKPIVGSSRVDLQACKLEYSIVSPK